MFRLDVVQSSSKKMHLCCTLHADVNGISRMTSARNGELCGTCRGILEKQTALAKNLS